MKKNILVTGGAGFIGSNLNDELLKTGFSVYSLDNFDAFYEKGTKQNNIREALFHPHYRPYEGDIRDAKMLGSIFRDHNIDTVVHLASKAGVRPSILSPEEYFDVNVNGTLSLLKAMQEAGVKKLIFASSSSIYGNNLKIPYSETDVVDFPISPYAASKKATELITHVYHHLYGINVINFRFFTVYGARQRPDLAIHKFFHKLYTNQPIEIYGDGSTSRDYTYIDDIVKAIISGIAFLDNTGHAYEIINLGNSNPVKLLDLISHIEDVSGRKFIRHHREMQEGDVNLTFADISKARKLLNYSPDTGIREGLMKFRKWYESNYF
ncbi:MAG: SDR family NAD(P)-dependent oxidoreductase [Bacteroidia bacterium]|nr:SDR family NAD(P)-dependent oxidoreductase [Bacteroidia bacterium]